MQANTKSVIDASKQAWESHDIGHATGLEFLVAADTAHTVLTPTLQDLGVLAAVVGIHTVISISINLELKQAKKNTA